MLMNKAPLSRSTFRSKLKIIPLSVWYVEMTRTKKEMTRTLLKFILGLILFGLIADYREASVIIIRILCHGLFSSLMNDTK